MTLTFILGGLTVLSLGLTLWQIVVAARFPLHRQIAETTYTPGVTILKPLKGRDTKTAACLSSWLEQIYEGQMEVIFGISSSDDPVCDLVRELIERHPGRDLRLLICQDKLGPNAKVSKLIQMERQAKHEVICVSDADVWAPPKLLANLVVPLHDVDAGLVNCFYKMVHPANLAMRWEAFAVNADFWSQVLQSASLKPMDFALGAVMAMPRRQLNAVGGFAALADYLADDYELGHRIAGCGGRIELCPVVVECRSEPMSFVEVWRHQLRWARTIRFCQPLPYFFSILSNGTLWPLLWVALRPSRTAMLAAAGCLGARMLSGAWLEKRMTKRFCVASPAIALAKDILQVGVWLLAFTGRQVVWRGERFKVEPGGKLSPAARSM